MQLIPPASVGEARKGHENDRKSLTTLTAMDAQAHALQLAQRMAQAASDDDVEVSASDEEF